MLEEPPCSDLAMHCAQPVCPEYVAISTSLAFAVELALLLGLASVRASGRFVFGDGIRVGPADYSGNPDQQDKLMALLYKAIPLTESPASQWA